MPTDKLTFRLIGKEAAVIRLLFLKGLLLLGYVFFISHRAQNHTSSVESPKGNFGV